MKKWLVMLCACLALGLVAAGCGDDDDGSSESSATPEQTTPAAQTDTDANGKDGAAGASAKPTQVAIVDNDYDPKNVTVPSGTTITWTNTGNLPHTVTKEDGPGSGFDSDTIDPQGTFELKVDKPGTINYVCTIHSGQEGSITVE